MDRSTVLVIYVVLCCAISYTEANQYPIWPFDFKWSVTGKVNDSDYSCVQINEPLQPWYQFWSDNYLCYKSTGYSDPGITWSMMNAKPGMKCTRFWEPSDTMDWHDNYLCVPLDSPYNFKYSYIGCYKDLDCISVNEPGDPNMWFDNYLCNKRTGRINDTYTMSTPCVYFNNADYKIISSFWLTAFLSAVAYVGFA